MGFWTETSHEYKELNHILWWILCIFHQDVSIWKWFFYLLALGEKVYLGVKEQLFLYYEYKQKNLDKWENPLQRKQETHTA